MSVLMASEFHRMHLKHTLRSHDLSFYVNQKYPLMIELPFQDVHNNIMWMMTSGHSTSFWISDSVPHMLDVFLLCYIIATSFHLVLLRVRRHIFEKFGPLGAPFLSFFSVMLLGVNNFWYCWNWTSCPFLFHIHNVSHQFCFMFCL